MIIGILGKGGSGKSTISTLLVKHLLDKKKRVLAIDADHNMDLSYNLGLEDKKMHFLGSALPDLLEYCNLDKEEKYFESFFKEADPEFTLSPKRDAFSQKHIKNLSSTLGLMTSGPHTDKVLHGRYCSHALSTPLKVYLPFLQLQEDEVVVIDEKAGSDGAGTGICSGMDVACVICEPTDHGLKAGRQISELLAYYGTPHIFIGNKILDAEDEEFLSSAKNLDFTAFFKHAKQTRNLKNEEASTENFEKILSQLESMDCGDRKKRSKEKFKRNKRFQKALKEKSSKDRSVHF